MAKLNQKLMNIDLDVVVDGECHALMRDGEDQTFAGNKTFDTPTKSLEDKPETKNTAVNQMMLYNATRCVNTPFEELLIVQEDDIANGYIKLGKEIPEGKESSLEIVNFEGSPKWVNGVDFGAETDRIVFTGYPIERFIAVEDRIEVRYAVCGPEMSLLEGIQKVVYSPTLRRFVAVCNTGMWWSDDGANWTLGTGYAYEGGSRASYWVPEIGRFVSFFYLDEVIIDGKKVIRYSTAYSDDGKTWKTTDSGAELLQGASVSSVKVADYNEESHYLITVDGVSLCVGYYDSSLDDGYEGYLIGPSGIYDPEDYGLEVQSCWDKGNNRFIYIENLYSSHSDWHEQRVYTESEENGLTYIGMLPETYDGYRLDSIYTTPRFNMLCYRIFSDNVYDDEYGGLISYKETYGCAIGNSKLKNWNGYKHNSCVFRVDEGVWKYFYSQNYFEMPTPVMYCSGIDVVMGTLPFADRYRWAVTRNGIHWGVIRDWEATGSLCWAENQEMFLEYGDNWIKARKFAVTDIINALQMSIPEPDTIIYLEGGDSGNDPDPGGGDPGSGYGDDDPWIDPNEDPRFKDRGEYLEYVGNFNDFPGL